MNGMQSVISFANLITLTHTLAEIIIPITVTMISIIFACNDHDKYFN